MGGAGRDVFNNSPIIRLLVIRQAFVSWINESEVTDWPFWRLPSSQTGIFLITHKMSGFWKEMTQNTQMFKYVIKESKSLKDWSTNGIAPKVFQDSFAISFILFLCVFLVQLLLPLILELWNSVVRKHWIQSEIRWEESCNFLTGVGLKALKMKGNNTRK